VGLAAVAGAPVAVLGAVGVDGGFAAGTVAWLAGLGTELSAVPVVLTPVLRAA